MNKNYYEFVFTSDLGKKVSLKIPNAKEMDIEYNLDNIKKSMDEIINLNIILTRMGSPKSRLYFKYVQPTEIDIEIEKQK